MKRLWYLDEWNNMEVEDRWVDDEEVEEYLNDGSFETYEEAKEELKRYCEMNDIPFEE